MAMRSLAKACYRPAPSLLSSFARPPSSSVAISSASFRSIRHYRQYRRPISNSVCITQQFFNYRKLPAVASSSSSAPLEQSMTSRSATEPLGWAVEGNICAGKTTLCSLLLSPPASLSPLRSCSVAFEPIASEALSLFYSNTQKYAFWFQTYMLTLRMYEAAAITRQATTTQEGETETERDGVENTVRVLDRSLLGDYVFAVKQFLDGNISKEELGAYLAIREERGYGDPTASLPLLFIDSDPKVCLERIKERGVQSEQEIPFSYLDSLDAVYINVLLKFLQYSEQDAVVVVDADGEGQKEQLVRLMLGKEEFSVRRARFPKRPRVEFLHSNGEGEVEERLETYEGEYVHYRTGDDLEAYRLDRSVLPQCTLVVLKWGCWEEGRPPPPLPDEEFNAYHPRHVRRLLMAHLARGDDVLLYV